MVYGVGVVEEAEGDVTCSASYVEHAPAGVRAWVGGGGGARVDGADEVVSVGGRPSVLCSLSIEGTGESVRGNGK